MNLCTWWIWRKTPSFLVPLSPCLMEVVLDKNACRKCQTVQEGAYCNASDDTFVSDEVENKNSEAIVDAEDDDNDLVEDTFPSGEN